MAPSMADQAVNKWIIGETAKVREVVDVFLTPIGNDAAQALYAYFGAKSAIGTWNCQTAVERRDAPRRGNAPRDGLGD